MKMQNIGNFLNKNRRVIHLSFLFILLAFSWGNGQILNAIDQENIVFQDSIDFIQIKTDSIFNSNQIISLLTIPQNSFDRYNIEFDYSNPDFKRTSSFGKCNKALAAINGGFFNMDSGGSVTYFEINDSVISRTRPSDLKWGVSDSIINGAIVLTDDVITIHPAHSDQFYEQSKCEDAVLLSGPLLLLDSEMVKLPDMKFANDRHPRTCLCLKNESVVLITIDGRQDKANGMSLIEAQKFLLDMGCIDAINLDGGGSTTMWLQDKGIVNFPSDSLGERAVSNAILIIDEPGQ